MSPPTIPPIVRFWSNIDIDPGHMGDIVRRVAWAHVE